jgi:hypothetical protein
VYRSKAGGQDLEDDDENGAVDGDDDDTEINYRNNSHWKRAADCGLSNYVSYYDAASLYPSSGKKERTKERNTHYFCFHTTTPQTPPNNPSSSSSSR